MVSGRPKFPLWYFDRLPHDLRQTFTDEPAVDFVHELLKKCVVESENEIKLRDAGELLGEIDTAMAAVSYGRQLPGRNAKMRCQFCGLGTYEKSESFEIVGNLQHIGPSEPTIYVTTAGTSSHSSGGGTIHRLRGRRATSRAVLGAFFW